MNYFLAGGGIRSLETGVSSCQFPSEILHMIIIAPSLLKPAVFLHTIPNSNLPLHVEVLSALKGLHGYRSFTVTKAVL